MIHPVIPLPYDDVVYERFGNEEADTLFVRNLRAMIPNLDIHGLFSRSSHLDLDQSVAVLMPTIDILVPTETDLIEVAQIKAFREVNGLRRARFQGAADDLLKEFKGASTKRELDAALELIDEALTCEFHKVEADYRRANIEVAIRTVSTVGGAPALVGAVAAALGLSACAVCSFIGSISLSSAQILAGREKAKATVEESKWAFLWHLKRRFLRRA